MSHDHVKVMQRQFGKQHVNSAFPADQPHRLGQLANRRQQAVGKRLGDNICDADAQNRHRALLTQ